MYPKQCHTHLTMMTVFPKAVKENFALLLKNHRTVFLASHVMKAQERLLLGHLIQQTSSYQDPIQFIVELKMLSNTCFNKPIVIRHIRQHCFLFFNLSSAFKKLYPDLFCLCLCIQQMLLSRKKSSHHDKCYLKSAASKERAVG